MDTYIRTYLFAPIQVDDFPTSGSRNLHPFSQNLSRLASAKAFPSVSIDRHLPYVSTHNQTQSLINTYKNTQKCTHLLTHTHTHTQTHTHTNGHIHTHTYTHIHAHTHTYTHTHTLINIHLKYMLYVLLRSQLTLLSRHICSIPISQ